MFRFENAFAQTSMLLVVIGVVIAVCFIVVPLKKRLTDGMILILAGVVATLVDGWGFAIRHWVEGSFYFLPLILTIVSGMVMVNIFKENGMLGVLTQTLIRHFYKYPSVLLSFLVLIIMFPGMVTGSAPAVVLTTGVMIAPILMKMGIPRISVAAILAMASIAGQQAPPVNVPIMIICTSVFMPYEGFMAPLALLNFPLGIFSILFLGRKYVSVERLKTIAEEPPDPDLPPNSFKLYFPVLLLTIFLCGPRLVHGWPDMSTPLPFLIVSVVALFTGKQVNFFSSSKQTFGEAMNMIILFTGIGVLIQSMALTGVRGLIATVTVSLPHYILFPVFTVVGILLPGVLVPFGTAAVLGPPYILALQGLNSIILSCGAALIMGIGCLTPPTGIGGIFAMRVVGEEKYWPILKKCLVPTIVALILGLLFMIYANEIGQIPGLRYIPSKGSF
ncbi:MAG: TRAP transporter large permease subunit [Syntrophorhabdaceae bacterium]|nr:TRAP transporter large permease subunit [Syntrophorhabdaceae bacterium]